jgi:hypothetical protein
MKLSMLAPERLVDFSRVPWILNYERSMSLNSIVHLHAWAVLVYSINQSWGVSEAHTLISCNLIGQWAHGVAPCDATTVIQLDTTASVSSDRSSCLDVHPFE